MVSLLEGLDYLDKLAAVSCSLTHGPGMMKGLTFPSIKSLASLRPHVHLAKVAEGSAPRRAGVSQTQLVYNPTKVHDMDRRTYELYGRLESYTGACIYGCAC